MRIAVSTLIVASVSCAMCLSQQDKKTSQQPASATQPAPEPHSPMARRLFSVGRFPIGMVSDGTDIWIANGMSNTVTRDGAVLETFTVGTLPLQVAFDGANIWVTNGRSDSVSKLKSTLICKKEP
jgi:hypothetical protein